jgi:plastocyanin
MKAWMFRRMLSVTAVSAGVAVMGAGCNREVGSHRMTEMRAVATTQGNPHEVSIDNFSFSPATLTVARGATVTWVNHDDVPHTVTANDKQFGSKAMDTDDRFSQVFTAPGTYPYFCAVHPHMTGQIIVK